MSKIKIQIIETVEYRHDVILEVPDDITNDDIGTKLVDAEESSANYTNALEEIEEKGFNVVDKTKDELGFTTKVQIDGWKYI